jgi:hypothetical protein
MLVYPVIYFIWRGRKLNKSMEPTAEGELHEAGHQAS